MGRYRDVVINHLKRIQEGKEVFIPNPHGRMGESFHIFKQRYTLIGSNTGIGKSSFIDDTFLLKPYEWLQKQSFDYHYEVLYYSMERTERDKYTKWTAWKRYVDTKELMSSNHLSNCTKEEAPASVLIAEKYEKWADSLLDKVNVRQGPRSVEELSADIEATAKRVGVTITADATCIFLNDIKQGEFSPTVTKDTNVGKVPYRIVTLYGETLEIVPFSTNYILKKPNTFVFIVVDHIGKTKKGTEMIQKGAIDKLDNVLAHARDTYGFSPIVISQFNRAIGDFGRIKMANGDLSPIIEDFKDSSNTQESADLVLAPFDPYRYNSYDNNGNYKGYNLVPGMLHPRGDCRFRSLHILKNTYGSSQIVYGMKFLGEVAYFELLPFGSSPDINRVYAEIAQGK